MMRRINKIEEIEHKGIDSDKKMKIQDGKYLVEKECTIESDKHGLKIDSAVIQTNIKQSGWMSWNGVVETYEAAGLPKQAEEIAKQKKPIKTEKLYIKG